MTTIRKILQQTEPQSSGYGLKFLETIKYAIRSMPYGDFMEFTGKTGADPKRTWDYANET